MEKVGVNITAPIVKSLFSIEEHMTSGKESFFKHLADFSSKAFPEFSLFLIPKPYSPNDHKNPQASKANKKKFHQKSITKKFHFCFSKIKSRYLVKAAKKKNQCHPLIFSTGMESLSDKTEESQELSLFSHIPLIKPTGNKT